MKDLETLEFHPIVEKLTDILCIKTQNENPEFFRVLLHYYLSKVAATMRAKTISKDRGEIPINLYAINLASSGHGKGRASTFVEEQLIGVFEERYWNDVYPIVLEENLATIAAKRAVSRDEDEEEMLKEVTTEYNNSGEIYFSFDSGTSPAIKQMRRKLIMADIGAINFEMDELGSNLIGNTEALTTYLELFDVGKVKNKLTKDSKENNKGKEVTGRTPTNLLMFGTQSRVFDGDKVEEAFYSFMDTGYARRCIYGFSKGAKKPDITAEEMYERLVDASANQYIVDMAQYLGSLANTTNHNKIITIPKKVSILIIKYQMHCEKRAEMLKEHESIAKAEMAHRYFKAMKIAGMYAFIDGASEMTEDNYYHAIHMVETSGKAFQKILKRDRPHVKLAKYLGETEHEVTHVELAEDLPFFKGAISAKQEMLHYATAWGYKNHIVIKRSVTNGIEFLHGESLKKTDLDHLILSYSDSISDGYQNVQAPWDKLYKLVQSPGRHFINHHSDTGHRSEANMIPGCEMIVLDIDKGTTVKECLLLLKEYKFLLYTTKRHTSQDHRFRIIMPLNYHLKLDEDDYATFMENIYEWLPIDVDTATRQRSRKWLTCKGQYHYNDGEKLLDARLFIPKTSKNDERKQFIMDHQSLTNMERWFVNNSSDGNRNNQLIRYALMLKDLNYDFDSIRDCVLAMNSKLSNRLKKSELEKTVLTSIAKKLAA